MFNMLFLTFYHDLFCPGKQMIFKAYLIHYLLYLLYDINDYLFRMKMDTF